MEGGLVAHTPNEERDLNSTKPLFEDAQAVKTNPEMVKLAVQLIDRQTSQYDPSDTEDRYETRLRAMIEAKLKGERVTVDEEPAQVGSNVIDLMAALKKSLGQTTTEDKPAERKKPAAEKEPKKRPARQAATRAPRKRA
jgi:DNA end-binding protein Ku